MPRTVSNEATIDDPALIERVAIAIFEKTQGSWEYAREADREWLRLEAQTAIVTFLRCTRNEVGFSPSSRTDPAVGVRIQLVLLFAGERRGKSLGQNIRFLMFINAGRRILWWKGP